MYLKEYLLSTDRVLYFHILLQAFLKWQPCYFPVMAICFLVWIYLQFSILVQSQYATANNITEYEWGKIESALALQRYLAYVTTKHNGLVTIGIQAPTVLHFFYLVGRNRAISPCRREDQAQALLGKHENEDNHRGRYLSHHHHYYHCRDHVRLPNLKRRKFRSSGRHL